MNKKILQLLLLVASVTALSALAAWQNARGAVDEARALARANLLEPAARLLKENQSLLQELQAEPLGEKDSEILLSYLAKIRRDGVPRHVDMRRRLEQLEENNVAIATLLSAYSPQARTPGLKAATDKFRDYASAWRERWNSVMEIFMAGGTFASPEIPFPNVLVDSLQAEIDALR